jgi:lipoprotein-anchoring transpeptidase ErfK/SrfK
VRVPPRDWVSSMKSPITTAACLLAFAACAQAGQASAAPRVAAHQKIVALQSARGVRARPNPRDRLIAWVSATRPITGERTVLPVLAQTIDNHGRAWLRVRLPGHTLGAKASPKSGWISASNTLISTTAWHIVVNLGERQVHVYRDGRVLRSYSAIVGKPSTPTPTGEYFVEESVRVPADEPGGPFALATSDRSNVLQEFDGGPGQIAIHGLDNLGGQLGTAESHGCIRLADSAITWLVRRIGRGVPVTIS